MQDARTPLIHQRRRGLLQDSTEATTATNPPTPPPPDVAVNPATPTVVTTVAELLDAAAAAVEDIEIRAHLDLRDVRRSQNPDLPVLDNPGSPTRLALLYLRPPMRSIRVCPSLLRDGMWPIGLLPVVAHHDSIFLECGGACITKESTNNGNQEEAGSICFAM